MKKILAGILVGVTLIMILALPVMAEESTAVGSTVVTANNRQQNKNKGNTPGNGQNGQRGQAPGNGQNGQQGQAPGHGQNGQQGQAPGHGQKGKKGQVSGSNSQNNTAPKEKIDFKSLVEKGIIDQETYEKIEEYMKNNMSKGHASADSKTPREKPKGNSENAEAAPSETPDGNSESAETTPETTPSETPEGNSTNEGNTSSENPDAVSASTQKPPQIPDEGKQATQDDLLTRLVEEGILTQDQADAINALSDSTEDQSATAVENT